MMPANGPLISVIVATYNAAGMLPRCMDSVFGQTYENCELIIMDGGSTDGTVEIIRANSDRVTYWESKPDRGVYHAWNKALKRANGDWVCFLGADDYFWSSDVLEKLVPHLEAAEERGVRVVYGQLAVLTSGNRVLEITGLPWQLVRGRFLKEMSLPHVGAMHHRSLFEDHGAFDESFRIAGDYELLLRELKDNGAHFAEGVIIAGMPLGGVSTDPRLQLADIREVARARRKNGVPGVSLPLLRRRIRAVIRAAIAKVIGLHLTNRFVDLYRVCTGKPRKWTA